MVGERRQPCQAVRFHTSLAAGKPSGAVLLGFLIFDSINGGFMSARQRREIALQTRLRDCVMRAEWCLGRGEVGEARHWLCERTRIAIEAELEESERLRSDFEARFAMVGTKDA